MYRVVRITIEMVDANGIAVAPRVIVPPIPASIHFKLKDADVLNKNLPSLPLTNDQKAKVPDSPNANPHIFSHTRTSTSPLTTLDEEPVLVHDDECNWY